jgi:hypothetical protein
MMITTGIAKGFYIGGTALSLRLWYGLIRRDT